MSAPKPNHQPEGRPDGGQFASTTRAEDSSVALADPVGPTAEDRAQLAAIYRDAAIASEANIRLELGCTKMLAQGVLRQWPSAKYLVLTESDQGTGSQYPGAVLASADPDDSLAHLEYEELANGANPEDMASNLSPDGPWMDYAVAHPGGRATESIYLDLHAAAAIEVPQPTQTISAPQSEATVKVSDSEMRAVRTLRQLKARKEAEQIDKEKVEAVVLQLVPNAVSWTVDSEEVHGIGCFYTASSIWARPADMNASLHVDAWSIPGTAGQEARAQLEEPLASLTDRNGPLSIDSIYTAHIGMTR